MPEQNLHHDHSASRDLTPREQQLVDLVSQGKLNKEIAHELNLAEGTVRDYLSRLFRKVEVKNRTELAVWAMKRRRTAA
ncbi:MAG: DNA-binding response regulator [Candidatus Solibacter sp.]|jgi:DNA-binding NarL/FixJ family response regulator|nr:DNA-binding response regulator [Candidatus Solibacter sp.]